jgi:hypothetical protein
MEEFCPVNLIVGNISCRIACGDEVPSGNTNVHKAMKQTCKICPLHLSVSDLLALCIARTAYNRMTVLYMTKKLGVVLIEAAMA